MLPFGASRPASQHFLAPVIVAIPGHERPRRPPRLGVSERSWSPPRSPSRSLGMLPRLAALRRRPRPRPTRRWRGALPAVHRLLANKYYVDEIYDAAVIVRPLRATARLFCLDAGSSTAAGQRRRNVTVELVGASGLFDKLWSTVWSTAWAPYWRGARAASRIQTGNVSNYALVLVAGMFVLVCVVLICCMMRQLLGRAMFARQHSDPRSSCSSRCSARSALLFFMPGQRHASAKSATGVALVDFRRLVAAALVRRFAPGRRHAGCAVPTTSRLDWIPAIGVRYDLGDRRHLAAAGAADRRCSARSPSCSLVERHPDTASKEYYAASCSCCRPACSASSSRSTSSSSTSSGRSCWCRCTSSSASGAGRGELYAAIKFFLYTLAGSVLMLLGILALYFCNVDRLLSSTGDSASFRILQFDAASASAVPARPADRGSSSAFFVGFAIKVPMFPFHTWLPDAHVEAPTAGSVILAGVLLKMGTYGFLRFALPHLARRRRVSSLPWIGASGDHRHRLRRARAPWRRRT